MTVRLPQCLLGVLSVLILAASALAQDDSTSSFGETVDVEVVNLEVFVTDSKGNAVRGLGPEEFVLREGGKRVEISNFYAVEGGRRVAGGQIDGIDVPAVPGESRPDPLFLTVYVDNTHLSPFSRRRVVEQLRDFLKQRARDGDQIMLASGGGTVRVVQSFTRDWKEIERALAALEREAGLGVSKEERHREVINEILEIHDFLLNAGPSGGRVGEGGSNPPCARDIEIPAQRYSAELYGEVERSARQLEGFVESMASLPGRKVVLHVSDGIPRLPGAEVYEFLHRFCGGAGAADGLEEVYDASTLGPQAYQAQLAQLDAQKYDTSKVWESLTETANANGVTFFSLEAYGPRSLGAGASEAQGRRVSWQQIDYVRVGNLQDTLSFLADETGGRAIFNTVDFGDALEKIGGDFDGYYSIGFTSLREQRDRDWRIEVDVTRPGLRVRHRKSFRAKPLSEKLADRTLGTLDFGLVDNPLGVTIEIGRPTALDDSLRMVPIRVHVPFGNLTFLSEGAEQRGRLSIFLAARDRSGRRAPVRRAEVPVSIPADALAAARDRDFVYEVKMLMREGAHSVAIGVRDDIAATASYVLEEIVITR